MKTTTARIYPVDKQRLIELRMKLSLEQKRIVSAADAICWLLDQPEALKRASSGESK